MQKSFLFFFYLICTFGLTAGEKRPQICLNMIVKDESLVIERCLASAKPLIDYWIIVDTGSTDGTQEIIKKFMQDIPGELHERPWVNFEHNRNEALNLAKEKADYLLFIDADDKFDILPDYRRPELDKDGYFIKINYSGSTYSRVQLIRTDFDWYWGGVVHEALTSISYPSMGKLENVIMTIIGGGDRSSDPKKFEKDAKMLEEALKKDPSNARNVFYLAQSYRDAGQLEKAIEVYERRVAMGGWDQEVFWSMYQIGIIQEALQMPEETIQQSYLKAYHFRPSRAEPLYRLSTHYRQQENYLMGYLFSQFALDFPLSEDPLFVESWIYEYGILLEHSICSYWIERYLESFNSSNAMLSRADLPQNVRDCVNNNLRFILPQLDTHQKNSLLQYAN